ncbi:hypothetical protein [Streptomyces noursei]|uniref:hypothetical protein n=1 Tax=Streptomyces noursei TaxID=1971 RepID=UPI0023B87694|nr:hypothetical protein [Streptomyces noursei]
MLDATTAHVNVLSVQSFPAVDQAAIDAAADRVDAWHERTGLPTLAADTGN